MTEYTAHQVEILKEIGDTLREVLKDASAPVNISVLLRGYRIKIGQDVPYEYFGYDDPVAFIVEQFDKLLEVEEGSPAFGLGGSIGNGHTVLVSLRNKDGVRSMHHRSPHHATMTTVSKPSERGNNDMNHTLTKDFTSSLFCRRTVGKVQNATTATVPTQSPPSSHTIKADRRLGVLMSSPTKTKALPLFGQKEESRGVFKALTCLGELFVVSLDRQLFVPSGCLAHLAGLSNDGPKEGVLAQLWAQEFENPNGMRYLSSKQAQHDYIRTQLALHACPFIIAPSGSIIDVIILFPLKCCAAVISAVSPAKRAKSAELLRGLVETPE